MNLPNKYLSAKFQNQAISLMRKWLGKVSESDKGDVIEQLLQAYDETASPMDKKHIGGLMAMIFELKSSEAASECAGRFAIETLPGLSVGESLMIDRAKTGYSTCWRKKFSSKVTDYRLNTADIDSDKHPLVFSSDAACKVFCLSSVDNIYAFRSAGDSAVNILVIDNSLNDTALIDEDSFCCGKNADYPLYFTDHSHFVSPIFRIRTIFRILNYILTEVGYPTFTTRPKVLFNRPNACLINASEYEPGGVHQKDWEGISVYLRRDYPSDYIFKSVGHIVPTPDTNSAEYEVTVKLISALAATAILYHDLSEENHLLFGSDHELAKLVRKSGIFLSAKPDEIHL